MPELAALKDRYIFVVRFLSQRMMDPHLYFETKYVSRIMQAGSHTEVEQVASEVLAWIDAGGLSVEGRAALNAALRGAGWPTLDRIGEDL